MMSVTDFAMAWIRAWDADDVESILALLDDEAVFASPLAARLLPGSNGTLEGKCAIREYLEMGIEKIPGHGSEIVNVLSGPDSMIIDYRDPNGALTTETFVFRNGLVIRRCAESDTISYPRSPSQTRQPPKPGATWDRKSRRQVRPSRFTARILIKVRICVRLPHRDATVRHSWHL